MKAIANPFEAMCSEAARRGWCWKFGCTTCGNQEVCRSLAKIAKGLHPTRSTKAEWRHAGTARFSDPEPTNQQSDAERLYQVVRQANPVRIALRERGQECALGCLGHVLLWLEDREHERGEITRSWRAAVRRFNDRRFIPLPGDTAELPNGPEQLTWRSAGSFGDCEFQLTPNDDREYLIGLTILGDLYAMGEDDGPKLERLGMSPLGTIEWQHNHLVLNVTGGGAAETPGVVAIVANGRIVRLDVAPKSQIKTAKSVVRRVERGLEDPSVRPSEDWEPWMFRLLPELIGRCEGGPVQVWGRQSAPLQTPVGEAPLAESARIEAGVVLAKLESPWTLWPLFNKRPRFANSHGL